MIVLVPFIRVAILWYLKMNKIISIPSHDPIQLQYNSVLFNAILSSRNAIAAAVLKLSFFTKRVTKFYF